MKHLLAMGNIHVSAENEISTLNRSSTSKALEFSLTALLTDLIAVIAERKEEAPFSMAIGKGELMHECFPCLMHDCAWEQNEFIRNMSSLN